MRKGIATETILIIFIASIIIAAVVISPYSSDVAQYVKQAPYKSPGFPSIPSHVCKDTDNGINPNTYGYVYFTDNPDSHYEDSCIGTDQVVEHYCEDNMVQFSYPHCPNGCLNGACIVTPVCGDTWCNGEETCETCPTDCGPCTCTDADGDGYDHIDWRHCPTGDDCRDDIPSINPGATEICNNYIDDDCDGLIDTNDPIDCPLCSDTDYGLNYYEKGTVTDINGVVKEDVCYYTNDGTLAEYYCNPETHTWAYDLYQCPYWCSDGVCVNNCMDRICGDGETCFNCPQDCGDCCGNGECDYEETTITCPEDCGSVCGDGVCNGAESAENCPHDCTSVCGDRECTHTETAQTCPEDCICTDTDGGIDYFKRGTVNDMYGITHVDACNPSNSQELFERYCNALGELETDYYTCPVACSGDICVDSYCGDNKCTGSETSSSCPEDCGVCACGDEICDLRCETCDSCSEDCGDCCGNGECDYGENCNTCPEDCGDCCGNGACETYWGETALNCQEDCLISCKHGYQEYTIIDIIEATVFSSPAILADVYLGDIDNAIYGASALGLHEDKIDYIELTDTRAAKTHIYNICKNDYTVSEPYCTSSNRFAISDYSESGLRCIELNDERIYAILYDEALWDWWPFW